MSKYSDCFTDSLTYYLKAPVLSCININSNIKFSSFLIQTNDKLNYFPEVFDFTIVFLLPLTRSASGVK